MTGKVIFVCVKITGKKKTANGVTLNGVDEKDFMTDVNNTVKKKQNGLTYSGRGCSGIKGRKFFFDEWRIITSSE